MNEPKTIYEFQGKDFEADIVKLYKDIRVMMASIYENGEFGPVAPREVPEGLKAKEIAKIRLQIESDQKAIKLGYDRIRNKSKEIRQNYRKAVSEGQRSGSGKVVCDIWELL